MVFFLQQKFKEFGQRLRNYTELIMIWLIGGIKNGGLILQQMFKDFVRYHVNIPDWSIADLCTKRITTVYYATEVLNNKLPAYISFDF